jgi:hypothetical protein
MRNWTRCILLSLVAAAICLLVFGSVAQAEPPEPVDTHLALEAPLPSPAGESTTVVAHLTTALGEPVADAGVEFLLEGEPLGRARTDGTGTASLVIRRDLAAGWYQLSALFSGVPSQGLQPSSTSTQLQITPAVLEIETVPHLSGVRFSLTQDLSQDGSPLEESGGYTFVSDEDGMARIGVEQAGLYRLDVHSWDDSESGVHAEFSRWLDEFTPSRQVDISSSTRLQVGFDVSYLVDISFVDLDGRPIDPERVESVTLTSTLGGSQTFDDPGQHWLQGGRAVRREDGLEETVAIYSVQGVVVNGSNVVNRSQQRFAPNDGREWRIQLLFYSAHISVRDALFRFPVGSAVSVQYPDGHSERFPLESGGGLTLGSLARGEYHVSVEGPGFSFSRPVTLSRNQEVDLLFISYLDIAVGFVLIVSILLALLFIGRPQLLSTLRARLFASRRAVRREDHL